MSSLPLASSCLRIYVTCLGYATVLYLPSFDSCAGNATSLSPQWRTCLWSAGLHQGNSLLWESPGAEGLDDRSKRREVVPCHAENAAYCCYHSQGKVILCNTINWIISLHGYLCISGVGHQINARYSTFLIQFSAAIFYLNYESSTSRLTCMPLANVRSLLFCCSL